MPDIHTGDGEYDHSVSAFIFSKTSDGQLKLLLQYHKKLGGLMQPGGHVELKETPWAALKHEVEEETGYDVAQLLLLQPKDGAIQFGDIANSIIHPIPVIISSHSFRGNETHYHTDWSYACITSEEPNNKPHEGESEELLWFTEQELATLSDTEIPPSIRTIGLAIFQQVINKWEIVPFNSFSTDNPNHYF